MGMGDECLPQPLPGEGAPLTIIEEAGCRTEDFLPPLSFEPRTIQPIASCYITDTVPVLIIIINIISILI
jgi:hypothetical protein